MINKLTLIMALLLSNVALAKIKKNGAAPDFQLKEVISGVEHKLSSYKDSIVVLEWHYPNCSFSSRHAGEKTMTRLEKKYATKGVVWFGIDSTGSGSDYGFLNYTTWKAKHDIAYPILRDTTGKVGRTYGASVTPHMVIINKGKVVYQGAIDDDTFGDKPNYQRKNYVDLALASLTKTGKLPKKFKQFNHAYGCGIKY